MLMKNPPFPLSHLSLPSVFFPIQSNGHVSWERANGRPLHSTVRHCNHDYQKRRRCGLLSQEKSNNRALSTSFVFTFQSHKSSIIACGRKRSRYFRNRVWESRFFDLFRYRERGHRVRHTSTPPTNDPQSYIHSRTIYLVQLQWSRSIRLENR
jgi:hypothetical protein